MEIAEIERRFREEGNRFTLFFVRRDGDVRWRCDAKQTADLGPTGTWLQAHAEWWGTVKLNYDPADFRLADIVAGPIRTINDNEYADEPRLDPSWLREYRDQVRGGAATEPLTVHGVWDNNRPDFVPVTHFLPAAVDWIHAILDAREKRQAGNFLVAAVVEGAFDGLVDLEAFPFATWDGRATPTDVPVERPRRRFGGLFAVRPSVESVRHTWPGRPVCVAVAVAGGR